MYCFYLLCHSYVGSSSSIYNQFSLIYVEKWAQTCVLSVKVFSFESDFTICMSVFLFIDVSGSFSEAIVVFSSACRKMPERKIAGVSTYLISIS